MDSKFYVSLFSFNGRRLRLLKHYTYRRYVAVTKLQRVHCVVTQTDGNKFVFLLSLSIETYRLRMRITPERVQLYVLLTYSIHQIILVGVSVGMYTKCPSKLWFQYPTCCKYDTSCHRRLAIGLHFVRGTGNSADVQPY